MLSRGFWRVLTAVLTVSILVLSLLPDPPEIPGGFRFADKIAHFVAYAALGFLLYISIADGKKRYTFLLSVAACFIFGGAIEILQFQTHRDSEFWDLAADLLGAVCGAAIGAGLKHRLLAKTG